MPFDLKTLVRPNILALEPYHCARDDFTEGILLDANENAHGPAIHETSPSEDKLNLHRYPDPHQLALKQKIANFRNSENKFPLTIDQLLTPANLCLGVGSDESIDALIRAVCRPGLDKIITCPPTYGMYPVSASINDVEIVSVPLELPSFQINTEKIIEKISKDSLIKLIFITTPGNPTSQLIDFSKIVPILESDWNGLVVADEAYIDFAPIGSSLSTLVNKYPNLVALQTLSKSFGLAAIRLGITYSSKQLSSVLNALKAPYNISTLTSDVALRALDDSNIALMRKNVEILKSERKRLWEELSEFRNVGKLLGGLDANFILVQIVDNDGTPDSKLAKKIYESLAISNGVVIRFRGSELGCAGGLRITIGTQEENDALVQRFGKVIQELE